MEVGKEKGREGGGKWERNEEGSKVPEEQDVKQRGTGENALEATGSERCFQQQKKENWQLKVKCYTDHATTDAQGTGISRVLESGTSGVLKKPYGNQPSVLGTHAAYDQFLGCPGCQTDCALLCWYLSNCILVKKGRSTNSHPRIS